MNLKLVKRFLVAVVIGIAVISCIDDGDDYVPPTKAEENALLSNYLDTLENRGMDIDTTELGVYYIIDSVGEGAFPVTGDTCSVKYTGFYIGGQIFDTSGDKTYDFVLGYDGLIDGWNDGMRMLNKGAKGYLIIPSEHGYGSTGYMGVPPNTTLVFGVEMVDIKQAY